MIYTITEDDLDRRLCKELYTDFADSLFEDGQEGRDRNSRKYYAGLLAELTFFVEDTTATEEIPFVPKIESTGVQGYDASQLVGRHFKRIPEYIWIVTMLSERYSYSEHIDLFIEACDGLGLKDTTMIRKDTWHPALLLRSNGMTGAEAFNALVAILRRDWTEKGYKSRFRRRVRESRERSKHYQAYVDAWFAELATIIVLRVDLSYKKKHWNETTLDDVIADLGHLYANFRCNKIFKGRRGYIAKIEYGLGKGFHAHMIFLYDTEHKQAIRHAYLTRQIGEYWVRTITKGRGDYWNCNARAQEFKKLGILGVGPIHATDIVARENLSARVVRYLCKMDQFIRPKRSDPKHLIRCGAWPKPKPKKRGAPRKSRSLATAIDSLVSEILFTDAPESGAEIREERDHFATVGREASQALISCVVQPTEFDDN